MYYVMRASAPSLHRESTDSLIALCISIACVFSSPRYRFYVNDCFRSPIHSRTLLTLSLYGAKLKWAISVVFITNARMCNAAIT